MENFQGSVHVFEKAARIGRDRIAVIAVEPAIIYSFVKKVRERSERVNASVNTMQNDPFALFVCQTAQNSNKSFSSNFVAVFFFMILNKLVREISSIRKFDRNICDEVSSENPSSTDRTQT